MNDEQPPPQLSRFKMLLMGLLRADHLYWTWALKNAPVLVRTWFEWLNWVLILAGLHIVSAKYHSGAAEAVLYISYMLLFLYFQSLYIRLGPEPAEHPVTHVKMPTMAAWLAASVGAWGLIMLARSIVSAILKATPK